MTSSSGYVVAAQRVKRAAEQLRRDELVEAGAHDAHLHALVDYLAFDDVDGHDGSSLLLYELSPTLNGTNRLVFHVLEQVPHAVRLGLQVAACSCSWGSISVATRSEISR